MISVIIPAFNAATTLGETLSSVMAQGHRAAQIIVVDDGSSDDTAAIAEHFSAVTVLRQTNGGVASALNRAIAASREDLIACLDADDLWSTDCLQSHLKHLTEKPQIQASVGFVDEFVCPSVPPQIAARFDPRNPQAGWLSGATVFSRQDFERVGPFDRSLRIGAWIDWVDRARLSGVVFDVTETLVLHRRLHPGSLSTMTQSQQQRNGAFLAIARNALNRRREQQS